MCSEKLIKFLKLVLLSPVIVSILRKSNVCSTAESSYERALNLKLESHIPLPSLRKSDKIVSFHKNDDQILEKEKQSISLRKSDDTYARSQDQREDDISSRILGLYHGHKSAKVIHSTRSVALQQPNVFVYLPSPISAIRRQEERKLNFGTNHEDCPKKSVLHEDYQKKSVLYEDRVVPNQEKVTNNSTINPIPVRDWIHMRKPFHNNRQVLEPLVPVTSKFVATEAVPTRVIDSTPVTQTSFAGPNNLVGFQRLALPPPPMDPLRVPPSPLLRSVPLMKQKAIIIRPAVPEKTISVYTTVYTPATKTVVYEAEHFPLRPAIQIFGIPILSFNSPFYTRYQSEAIPFFLTANYIKSTFRDKLFNSPAFLRTIGGIEEKAQNYRRITNPI